MFMSEPLQRVGPLAGIPALLQELGVEIDEVSKGLEIRREDLFTDNRIPFRSALQLLDRCAQASGRDHFGALLGTHFEFSSFGLIAEALKWRQRSVMP